SCSSRACSPSRCSFFVVVFPRPPPPPLFPYTTLFRSRFADFRQVGFSGTTASPRQSGALKGNGIRGIGQTVRLYNIPAFKLEKQVQCIPESLIHIELLIIG